MLIHLIKERALSTLVSCEWNRSKESRDKCQIPSAPSHCGKKPGEFASSDVLCGGALRPAVRAIVRATERTTARTTKVMSYAAGRRTVARMVVRTTARTVARTAERMVARTVAGKCRARGRGGQRNFARLRAQHFALFRGEVHPTMATPAPAKETPSLEMLIQQLAASVQEKLAPNTTLISAWGVALLSPNFRRNKLSDKMPLISFLVYCYRPGI